jgi:hypothetical protein
MPFTTTAQDEMLDALAGVSPTNIIAYASLHTAYSSSGANEITYSSGGRVSLSWSSASSGNKVLSAQPSAIDVTGGQTVEYVGFWSASSSGTFAGMGPVGAGTLYAFTAATSGNLFTAPGSSYSNGNTVVLFDGAGATIPSNFTVGTVYYIISASGATFELSATSGGSAITVNAAGAGLVQAIAPEAFGSNGTLQLTTGTTLYLF